MSMLLNLSWSITNSELDVEDENEDDVEAFAATAAATIVQMTAIETIAFHHFFPFVCGSGCPRTSPAAFVTEFAWLVTSVGLRELDSKH